MKKADKMTWRFGEEFVERFTRQVAWAQLKDPARRYTSVGIARHALERILTELEKKYGRPPDDADLKLL